MNVIDYEDRLHALSSIVATLGEVFPVVEVWTRQAQPLPGSRMVFVVAAGDTAHPRRQHHGPCPRPYPLWRAWPTAWCMSSPRRAGAS
jgi:hypothetical protein